MNRIQIRRRLAKALRRVHLPFLAAQVDPGPRMRLWDADWNLKADTDRGDHVDFTSLDGDGSIVFEPATTTTVRWSGRVA